MSLQVSVKWDLPTWFSEIKKAPSSEAVAALEKKTGEWATASALVTAPNSSDRLRREAIAPFRDNLKRECEAYQSFLEDKEAVKFLVEKIDEAIHHSQLPSHAGNLDVARKLTYLCSQRARIQRIFEQFAEKLPIAARALDAIILATKEQQEGLRKQQEGWLALIGRQVWTLCGGDPTPHLTEALDANKAEKLHVFSLGQGGFELIQATDAPPPSHSGGESEPWVKVGNPSKN